MRVFHVGICATSENMLRSLDQITSNCSLLLGHPQIFVISAAVIIFDSIQHFHASSWQLVVHAADLVVSSGCTQSFNATSPGIAPFHPRVVVNNQRVLSQ